MSNFSNFFSFDKSLNNQFTNNVSWTEIVPEPTNKMTTSIHRSHYYSLIKEQHGEFLPSTYLLEENVVTFPYFMHFPYRNSLTPVMIEKIDFMIASGLIHRFAEGHHLENCGKNLKNYEGDGEAQVLTVLSLGLGFYIILICLFISIVVFILELLAGLVTRRSSRQQNH
jgi:hypothetical protein